MIGNKLDSESVSSLDPEFVANVLTSVRDVTRQRGVTQAVVEKAALIAESAIAEAEKSNVSPTKAMRIAHRVARDFVNHLIDLQSQAASRARHEGEACRVHVRNAAETAARQAVESALIKNTGVKVSDALQAAAEAASAVYAR